MAGWAEDFSPKSAPQIVGAIPHMKKSGCAHAKYTSSVVALMDKI
jgi:hypothetical protein